MEKLTRKQKTKNQVIDAYTAIHFVGNHGDLKKFRDLMNKEFPLLAQRGMWCVEGVDEVDILFTN